MENVILYCLLLIFELEDILLASSTMRLISCNEKSLSTHPPHVITHVAQLLNSSHQHYLTATFSVYEWTISISHLNTHQLDFDQVAGSPHAHKHVLHSTLSSGIENMESAIVLLDTSSSFFGNATENLITLLSTLSAQFKKDSAFFESQVRKARKDAYSAALLGIVAGPLGLILSYFIAVFVVEAMVVPELYARLANIKGTFDSWHSSITIAVSSIAMSRKDVDTKRMSICQIMDTTKQFASGLQMHGIVNHDLAQYSNVLNVLCNSYQNTSSMCYL